MAWTQIGLDTSDYPRIAAQLIPVSISWERVEQIAVNDISGAFAIESFLIMPCMLMPDWGL